MKITTRSLVAVVVLSSAVSAAVAQTPVARARPFVWIEGEAPTKANIEVKPGSAEHADFLSEGKWLQFGAEANEVEKKVPAEGATFSYAFTAPAAGRNEV